MNSLAKSRRDDKKVRAGRSARGPLRVALFRHLLQKSGAEGQRFPARTAAVLAAGDGPLHRWRGVDGFACRLVRAPLRATFRLARGDMLWGVQ